MSKTLLRVVLGIIAIGIGIGMYTFWIQVRPADPTMTRIGVGVVTTIAAFVALYFMTKAGGNS